jgi:imidazolonepropionase-like amidohydrolase
VPTFTVLRKVLEIDAANPGMLPAYMAPKARWLVERQRESFPKALAAGVKIAMGTDAGGFGHGRNAAELASMVEAGMTPMQAIVAATRMGAACMDLGDTVGQLRAGMFADLLVVDGDPLTDVRVLEDRARLRLIMKDGVIIKDGVGAAGR